MNALLNAIQTKQNYTHTENGAVTLKSTLSHTLDFFGLGGSLRNRTEGDVIALFSKAFAEDRLLALKTLFYLRDIRGGQGERKTFRTCIKWIANEYPDVLVKNIENILEYGRWDDLFSLRGTKVWKVYILSRIEFEWKDSRPCVGGRPSLAWKWFPSENTSSKETRALASEIRRHLGITSKEYRKTLSARRAALDVVERKMCASQWSAIEYKAVPSKAALNYKNAFAKHDGNRYAQYIQAVQNGKTTINAGTLYPYDIAEKALKGDNSKTLDVLWSSLPNYSDKNENSLVVADVSGSMSGRPMAVAISLALYVSERNTGAFKDTFVTFSEKPVLQKVIGNNISERVWNLQSADWGMSTDLNAVFSLILNTAIENKVPATDMPERLYIVSDMEFNEACQYPEKTLFYNITELYKAAGYKRPELVFWNVNARSNQAPVKFDEEGTCLVSGCSPVVLKSLLAGKQMTPESVMLDTVNVARYNQVVA